MTTPYTPTRDQAKKQITKLLAVLEDEKLSPVGQVRIGSAVAFLQYVAETLPAGEPDPRGMIG